MKPAQHFAEYKHIAKRMGFITATYLVLFLLAGSAVAAPLSLSVTTVGGQAEIGKDFVLQLDLTPATGETIQSDAVRVQVTTSDGTAFFGDPYPLRTDNSPNNSSGLRLEWAAPVSADLAPSEAQVTVDVSVPGADGSVQHAQWQGSVTVDYGEDWSADRIADYIERRGLPLFLLVVFGFGLAMSITPCVYPMIPITLSVIGAQSQEKGTIQGLIMSFTYVVGMALVYAIMGALSATVFSGITAFMQSPAVLVPMALLLFALSFSMFGAFELQAPAFLRDRLQGPGGQRSGLVGTFAMGMVAGLVASPCVGPFLAALLVWVATTGNWLLGFLTLFTFGMGMGMLLIGVGTFPAMLGSMPSSGGWMETVKKGMGLLLVAMAFYFVRPGFVLPPDIFYPLIGLTAIVVAAFMGAFEPVPAESGWWPRGSKALGQAVFIAGVYWLLGSFLTHGFLMPSPLAGLGQTTAIALDSPTPRGLVLAETAVAPEPEPAEVSWTPIATGQHVAAFLAEKRAEAKAAGQPIMIDFTAKWCKLCKELDKQVWGTPEVAQEAGRFLTIRIDVTKPDDAEMTQIKTDFRVPGPPRVIFIDSRGEVLHGRTAGLMEPAEMVDLMKSIR